MVRETPLHIGHLRQMTRAAEAGAVIMPPVHAFYQKPSSVGEIVETTAARALDLLGLEHDLVPRWGGDPPR
jgi:4-hydroxy-3-polyprenylbenzoate decarboxylase